MTFLEIANQVAFLSGTFPSLTAISTVTGQIGRKAQVVNWTNVAWQRIQTIRPDWGWMRTEFTSAAVLTPTQRYAASDFSITRFSRWIYNPKTSDSGLSLYRTSLGVSDEQPLTFYAWESFRRVFTRGTQTAARPGFFSVDSAGRLCLGPAPDYDYTIRGEYQKSPQVMTAGSDVPECPIENHWVIVWYALVLLAESDEAVQQDPLWRVSYKAEMSKLERAQLPRLVDADPIA